MIWLLPAEIDLANLNGQVMNLPHHQSAVAADVLGLKEEYILVSVNGKEIEENVIHTGADWGSKKTALDFFPK